jgi:pyridoxamine 5'-phosphate oxidase
LKSFDQQGFVFYTNYLSPKAQYIKEVPKGAMVFWWPLCQRQVRITGNIVLVGEQKSDAYFQQRSKSSRIAAIVSKQSATIPDRDYLLKQFQALSKDYADATNIPRPDYWGGYVLEHQSIEFWQGRSHRLHDRFLYTREAKGWKIEQLSP